MTKNKLLKSPNNNQRKRAFKAFHKKHNLGSYTPSEAKVHLLNHFYNDVTGDISLRAKGIIKASAPTRFHVKETGHRLNSKVKQIKNTEQEKEHIELKTVQEACALINDLFFIERATVEQSIEVKQIVDRYAFRTRKAYENFEKNLKQMTGICNNSKEINYAAKCKYTTQENEELEVTQYYDLSFTFTA